MLVAMAEDVRVLLMKLADRLHNMRTVNYLPENRRRAMGQETLDIYAPLAHRLGMWNIKWELEDLSFAQLHPDEYQEIVKKIARKRKERETYVKDRKSTRLNSSHDQTSYAVFCWKKKSAGKTAPPRMR